MPPAAPPADAQSLTHLLVRSRLMSADEVRAATQRWSAEAPADQRDAVEPFRRFLVANRLLTEYQSQMLLRGHADGFFLDAFKILDRVGKGRMAGVYKAIGPGGQIAALKVLPPSKAKDANLLGRFQREAKLVTQLNHPNIVRALSTGEANGLHYIGMEHLEGDTVQEVLDRRKRLTPPEAVRIVYQVLQGLQQVHERGMVHRDVKPSNLMLVAPPGQAFNPESTLNCTAKILDIGLGKAIFDEDDEKAADQQLTADGVLLGTPDYLAPEQARSATNVDIRADIYSVGCVLYHLLTGQPPFPDTNVLNQVIRHATEQPKPLASLVPGLPEGLQSVVSVMLAKDPNQRYPSPAMAAAALKPLLGDPPDGNEASMSAYVMWLGGDARAAAAPPAEVPMGKLADRKRREPEPPAPRKVRREKSPAVAAEDIDVELVAIAPPAPSEADRPLTEFNRRDIIMLSAGGGGVAAAFIVGLLLATLMKKPDPRLQGEEDAQTKQ